MATECQSVNSHVIIAINSSFYVVYRCFMLTEGVEDASTAMHENDKAYYSN